MGSKFVPRCIVRAITCLTNPTDRQQASLLPLSSHEDTELRSRYHSLFVHLLDQQRSTAIIARSQTKETLETALTLILYKELYILSLYVCAIVTWEGNTINDDWPTAAHATAVTHINVFTRALKSRALS